MASSAFVAAAPVFSRRAFAGAAVAQASAPASGAAVTMRATKVMPKDIRKRSKALPMAEAPEGLKESQDGCM